MHRSGAAARARACLWLCSGCQGAQMRRLGRNLITPDDHITPKSESVSFLPSRLRFGAPVAKLVKAWVLCTQDRGVRYQTHARAIDGPHTRSPVVVVDPHPLEQFEPRLVHNFCPFFVLATTPVPVSKSINQSINRSIDQSINRSIDQSISRSTSFFFSYTVDTFLFSIYHTHLHHLKRSRPGTPSPAPSPRPARLRSP